MVRARSHTIARLETCVSKCVCVSHAYRTVRACEASLYLGAVAGVWLIVRVTAQVEILAGA